MPEMLILGYPNAFLSVSSMQLPKMYCHTRCTSMKARSAVCCIALCLSLIFWTVDSKARTTSYSPLYSQSQPQCRRQRKCTINLVNE